MTERRKRSKNEVPALAVVSPLILQPTAISLNTANLLTIVVRNRVGDRISRRINPEPTDTIKELLLFLRIGTKFHISKKSST
jgi:hypothetical protein